MKVIVLFDPNEKNIIRGVIVASTVEAERLPMEQISAIVNEAGGVDEAEDELTALGFEYPKYDTAEVD